MTASSTPSTLIGIVGAGTMGSGIAQLAAAAGHPVLIYDERKEAASSALGRVAAGLTKLVEKGKLSESESTEASGRLQVAAALDGLSGAGVVIEAIVEEYRAKKKLFSLLGTIVPQDSIVATNTSSLSVTRLARSFARPERFVGMHFFNPAPVIELVEVVPALQTANATAGRAVELLRRWNKDPIIAKDTPGFLVNRIARPFYGEALRIAEEGLATPEEIDSALRKYGRFKMGPFELMDLIGNDVNYAVTESVFRETFFDRRYLPSTLQQKYVEAGFFGKKSGRGFYDYSRERPEAEIEPARASDILLRVLVMLINEAVEALRMGLASKDDIERAMTKGTDYPLGLLHWADEIGPGEVRARLSALFEVYGDDRYRPSPLLKLMARDGRKFFS
jgi:3-hydroxybutyryl-CoA dehydrogenase